jgi:hypothetical protein
MIHGMPRLKVNKWGIASIGVFVVSFVAVGVCQRLFHDDKNACLIPYIVLHLSTVAFGILAAVWGSKWWLLMSLLSALMAIQAIGALFVE